MILALYIGFLESIRKLCKFPSSLLASAHLGHFIYEQKFYSLVRVELILVASEN